MINCRGALSAAARGWRMIFRRFRAPSVTATGSWRAMIDARPDLRWKKQGTELLFRPAERRCFALPGAYGRIHAEAPLPLRVPVGGVEDRPSPRFEATRGFGRLAGIAIVGGIVNAHVRESRAGQSGLTTRSLVVAVVPASAFRARWDRSR